MPGVNLQPNLQWIIHPGGSDRSYALGLGLNTLILF
ncbi:carbohydrate porin [Pseudomonas moorei]